MRPQPYIGITGFMSRNEVTEVFNGTPYPTLPVRAMLGVLVSHKSLHGVVGLEGSNPKRYPNPAVISQIFPPRSDVLNLIHFNTGVPEKLGEDLVLAQQVAGAACHGFQLNVFWPEPTVLALYKKAMPAGRNTLVLQLGAKALAKVDNSPDKLRAQMEKYQGLVEHVLLDASGGEGKDFDTNTMLRYLERLSRLEWLGPGIAGGFYSGNVYRLEEIIRETGEMISFDAEHKLRDEQDNLSVRKARQYLYESSLLYDRFKHAA